MQYVVLLAAILILAGSVFLGYRKGFIRTALGMLALVLSLVIMQLIGPAVGNFLMEDSGLYEKTSRTIAESLKASVDLPETSDLSDIPADMVTPELEAQAGEAGAGADISSGSSGSGDPGEFITFRCGKSWRGCGF